MNETLKDITNRFSCRAFTDAPPIKAQLQEIANAAIAAPSAMNRQPWRVIVVTNKALIYDMEQEAMTALSHMADKSMYERIMGRGGKLFYNAPAMFMIPMESEGAALDCGIVCENIAIAAASLGMGSLICGLARFAFSKEKENEFRQRLGYPEGYIHGMAVLVGFPEKITEPHAPDVSKISFID